MLEDGMDLEEAISLAEQNHKSESGRFNNFWKAVEKVLNEEDLTVAEERRQTETTWISPHCTSLKNLHSACCQKMLEMFPLEKENLIPSYEYFRLQFTPRSTHSNVSKRYYSRFDIKFGIQKRTLRKAHIDQHYACKQWKLVKEFGCMYNENTLQVFWDDKAQIPVGFLNTPSSTLPRQRGVLMVGLGERGLVATDHDNIPQHITPSVSIKLTPPSTLSGDWYTGRPTVTLKDSIFEHSNAFRHVTEFENTLNPEERAKPIMCFGSDGGKDHNVTNIQVILSLIALFKRLDLDYLSACRTPPHFSFINPAERLMSTLNIALYGVSLARNDVGEYENKVSKFLSKSQWRTAQANSPKIDFKKLAKLGTKDARSLLNHRFGSLNYKGETFETYESATEEEIESMKDTIREMWPEFDLSSIKKENAMKNDDFKRFFDEHIRLTNYCLTIKKCKDLSCRYHEWPRLDDSIFNTLHFMPSPTPSTNGESYKKYSETYGDEPTDKYCPSLNNRDRTDSSIPKPPFQLVKTNARFIKVCSSCSFPRILYSRKQLTNIEKKKTDQFFEEIDYICGMDMQKVPFLFQHHKTVCFAPICLQYYQLGQKISGYEPLCHKCLSENVPVQDEKRLECDNCKKEAGKYVKEKSKKPVGRPKKK